MIGGVPGPLSSTLPERAGHHSAAGRARIPAAELVRLLPSRQENRFDAFHLSPEVGTRSDLRIDTEHPSLTMIEMTTHNQAKFRLRSEQSDKRGSAVVTEP